MDTTAPSDTAIKKIPTARQVGAVLRAAGFEASQSYPTRIRGFRNHTRGYSTRTYLPVNGCPVVSHVCGERPALKLKRNQPHHENGEDRFKRSHWPAPLKVRTWTLEAPAPDVVELLFLLHPEMNAAPMATNNRSRAPTDFLFFMISSLSISL
jgi:hypothetical protein